MKNDRFQLTRFQLLSIVRLPARMNLQEAAYLLGFHEDALSYLVSIGMLKPLGQPPKGAPLWFSSTNLQELLANDKWLAKATQAVRLRVKSMNDAALNANGSE